MTEVTDADQIQGSEFGKVLKIWWFWVITAVASVVAGAAATGYSGSPVWGAAAFVAVVAFCLVCAFAYANAISKEAFYDGYAKSRGLERNNAPFDKLTPFLEKGDSNFTNARFTGELKDGLQGSIALYTYSDEGRNPDGSKRSDDHPFTLVHVTVPDAKHRLPTLLTERRSGLTALEGLEDRFRDHERVRLESQALDERFEIFVNPGQDQSFLRQVFSPSFIVWLAEEPPPEFAFELVDDQLIAFVPNHKDSAKDFDTMIEAACTVAARVRDESAE